MNSVDWLEVRMKLHCTQSEDWRGLESGKSFLHTSDTDRAGIVMCMQYG